MKRKLTTDNKKEIELLNQLLSFYIYKIQDLAVDNLMTISEEKLSLLHDYETKADELLMNNTAEVFDERI